MADEEQVAMLKRSLKEWNQFRKEFPREKIDLIEADLSGVNLGRANLANANLYNANLYNANLSKAELSGANLEKADLIGVNLEETKLIGSKLNGTKLIEANLNRAELVHAKLNEAELTNANLQRANLHSANLSKAEFSGAKLEDADLIEANLSEARFYRANLQRAKLNKATLHETLLIEANLREAELNGADLKGIDLVGANFNGADLSDTQGDFELNDNSIKDTIFSPNSKDKYSILRRTYTGPLFFITIFLVIIAILPYLIEAMSLYTVASSNISLKTGPTIAYSIHDLWYIALGLNRGLEQGFISIGLISYNFLRGFLTIKMTGIRDAEERSHHAPTRDTYLPYWKIHKILSLFLWFAVGMFLIRVGCVLFTAVELPISVEYSKPTSITP